MSDTDTWLNSSRRRFLAILGTGATAGVAGCSSGGQGSGGGSGSSSSANGSSAGSSGTNEIAIGLAQGSWDLIPARDTDFVSNLVYTLVYDNLVTLSPKVKLTPELATDWKRESDTQYVFTLRDGVTFHNGESFGPKDVKYTYQWIENNENPRKNYLEPVEDVVIENDTTVRFDLEEKYAPFLYKVQAVMWPLSKKAVEKSGENYNQHPVGTGPFRFTEWKSGDHATLEKYDDYWHEDQPHIDKITIKILPQDSSKVSQLEAGTIDLLDTMPPQYTDRVKSSNNVEILTRGGVSSGRIDFNTDNEALGKKQVRRALAWAIDKKQIVKTVLQGYGTPGKSVLPNSLPAYNDSIKDFKHPTGDTSKAKQLLSEAGYDSLDLQIKTSTRSTHKQTATLIQNMWKKIGVNASVKSMNADTFYNQELEGNFEVAVSNWTWFGDPDTLLYLYHSDGLNPWNISNDDLDSLIEKQRVTIDSKKRDQLIDRIQKTVYEEAYSIYPYYPKRIQGISTSIDGFKQYPSGSFRSLDAATLNK